MKKTLADKEVSRPTALKELQMEEGREPFKILIGTILSARSRDENTRMVLSNLFYRYRNVFELSHANEDDVKKLIHSIGFYNIKAKRIIEVSKILVDRFQGIVPTSLDDLILLPGVGRKTANCVLVYAFRKSAIPVDIHVHRISNRIGLVSTNNPEKTEDELVKIVDKQYWLEINEVFVMFGQNICLPLRPKCHICLVKDICKFYVSHVSR